MIHHPMKAGRTCCSMHVLLAPLCTYSTTYHSVITMAPWGNNWTKAGAFGSVCTCCNNHGSYLGAQRPSFGDWARVNTGPGPVVSQVIGPRRFFEWKPCDLCGGCHVRQAYQWALLPVGTAEGDAAGLL